MSSRSLTTPSMGALEYTSSVIVDFVGTPLVGYNPLSVQFTDLCSGETIVNWDWDFGDGGAHGIAQNPIHVYTEPGFYTVILSVNSGYGIETKINYISLIDINKFFATPDSTMRIDELKIYRGDKDYDEYFSSLAKTARKMNSY